MHTHTEIHEACKGERERGREKRIVEGMKKERRET